MVMMDFKLSFFLICMGGNLDSSTLKTFPKSENTAVRWCGALKEQENVVLSADCFPERFTHPMIVLCLHSWGCAFAWGVWLLRACNAGIHLTSYGAGVPRGRQCGLLRAGFVRDLHVLFLSLVNLIHLQEMGECHFHLFTAGEWRCWEPPWLTYNYNCGLWGSEEVAAEEGIDHKLSDSTLLIRTACFICG